MKYITKKSGLPKLAEDDNSPIDIQFIIDVMGAFIAKKRATS